MEREVAPETDQERVVEPPAVMEKGEAVKEEMTGAGAAGKDRVVKVKSGEEVLLFKASMEVTLK